MASTEDNEYRFDADINLDDLVQSAIDDLMNPETCAEANEFEEKLGSFQPTVKLIDRRQKEINRMFADCQMQLDNFMEKLEETEQIEEKQYQEAKNKFSEAAQFPSEITIEDSDHEDDDAGDDDDDDDDVQFIQTTVDPNLVAKQQAQNPTSDIKTADIKPKDGSIQAQTREKLVAALNNAGSTPQPTNVQTMRKYLTASLAKQTHVVTIPTIRCQMLSALGKEKIRPKGIGIDEIRRNYDKVVSQQVEGTLPLPPPPRPSPSFIHLVPPPTSSSSSSSFSVNQPSPTPPTLPINLSSLQRKPGSPWPHYSTSLANQEKMEKLYLEDVNNIKSQTLVLYRKFQDLWEKGTLMDIVHSNKAVSERKYKVKCDTKKGLKTLTSRQIAFSWSITKPVTVGTRIVAYLRGWKDDKPTLYKEDESGEAFYAGIVAEAPNGRNDLRYLVFFDDGYAQYCTSKEIYKVFYQSKPVWEDIHPGSQEFVRDYLAQYPERPMVRLHKGQSVKTEWNGKWWNARVEAVDASLVSMYFAADQRSEWIYRGSTRLEPLYTALANAEANRNAGKVKRHNLSSTGPKKPVVEYTRNNSTDSPKQDKPDKKKSVAKKSTTPQSAMNTLNTGKIWESNWMKKKTPVDVKPSLTVPATDKYSTTTISNNGTTDNKDMATVLQERLVPTEDSGSIDLEALGTRLDQIVPLKDKEKKMFGSHQCSTKCVLESKDDPEKFKGSNPLLIALFMGWERHVAKLKPSGRRVIFYQAPCGKRLRSMEELDLYLQITDCSLAIDGFCYDTELHVNYEFIPVKTFCDIKDISYGKENVSISCVNGIDRQYPDYVDYSNQRIPATGVKLNLESEFLVCCDCTDNCRDKTKCACQQLTIESSAITHGGKPNSEAGYTHRRLLEPLISGVYECNSRCGCDKRCVNRVVQNGLQNRLQVFKTEKRGWGLRCLDDIPKGGFICIYAGQLLTDQGANEDGQQYGDEYLAELDYMEVVERHKDGYESDVEDIDEEIADDFDEDEEDSQNDEMASDSDDSFSKQNKKSIQKVKDVEEKSHQTRRAAGRLKRKQEGLSDKGESSQQSQNENKKGATERKPKQTAQKSTTLPPRNKPASTAGDDELPDLDEDRGRKSASPLPPSNDQTEGESKKRRTGRSTAARFGNMVPSKKDKEGDEEEVKYLPTRDYYNDDQSCYIMDAKSMGNIGRYLNHSCLPCAFVQNVFVDTHDLRFPWIAFFAGQYISAGTELTWDYNYEVGSVPGKVLYCYCGSSDCRGRLL